MKNLFSYKNFINEKNEILNEAKKSNPLNAFKKDVKGLLDDMFAKVKKPEYKYNDAGFPTEVEFEIDRNDFIVDYKRIDTEFSEGVLKKREFVPVLVFDEKEEEGKDKTYKITFKIEKEAVEHKGKEEKPRSEQLERDSDEQLLAKLKSKKVTDENKEKIMKLLKDRDVKFKNPFDDEDDKPDSEKEKEAEKAAAKEAKKEAKKDAKNESFHMPDGTPIPVDKNHQPIKEEKKEEVEECDCKKKKEKECDCKDEDDKVNEGLLGKIAKLLSKKEYDKTVNACSNCETKEDVKDVLSNMIFSKVTKKSLDDDSKMFNSLVDEVYKDCKKKEKKNESVVFGTEEWNQKYGIKVEKEEVKVKSFDSLVNETLNNNDVEYTSLNEKINNTLEDNDPKALETIKKDKE